VEVLFGRRFAIRGLFDGKVEQSRLYTAGAGMRGLVALLIVIQFVLARKWLNICRSACRSSLSKRSLVPSSEAAFGLFKSPQDVPSDLLIAIATLHILAALKRHFASEDDWLVRMPPEIDLEEKRFLSVICSWSHETRSPSGRSHQSIQDASNEGDYREHRNLKL
jgi:hypothetical protein